MQTAKKHPPSDALAYLGPSVSETMHKHGNGMPNMGPLEGVYQQRRTPLARAVATYARTLLRQMAAHVTRASAVRSRAMRAARRGSDLGSPARGSLEVT